MNPTSTMILALAGALSLAACSDEAAPKKHEVTGEASVRTDQVLLTQRQIDQAGIELARPTLGEGGGTIELPATIAGDPQATEIVSAAIGGRIVALDRNLGDRVARGERLAVIESREAAELKGRLEASRARLALANSILAREQQLFAERVSPEQDLIAARTASTEARIAFAQARQQLAATGAGGGSLNRIEVRAPIAGAVVARPALLGQTVTAETELFRVANLDRVSLSISLSPADAGRVSRGAAVLVSAPGRQATARVDFISPALDAETKMVPVIAALDNRDGRWRVGEAVTAAVTLAGSGDKAIRVPLTAVQTVEGRTSLFVRNDQGFRLVPVVLGRKAGDLGIVTKGLSGGEQIATVNSFTLKSALRASTDED